MTTSTELNRRLRHIGEYIGTYPSDLLPKITKFPAALILNTDPSNKPGQHWVAVYIKRNGVGEYFDPFGLQPLMNEFINFLDNNCPNGWTFNDNTIQGINSINCGRFCYMFIILKSLDYSLVQIIKLFSRIHLLNDAIIDKYYNLFV